MGYKLLGFVVWRAGKWYVGRRLSGTTAKLALGGVGAAAVAVAVTGVVVASRHATKNDV